MPIFKVGTDDFKELRDDGGYFVDKSLLIKEVIAGSKSLLLPRPRRFGKTLNLSMLRYFFEQSAEDRSYLFQDLAVASLPEVMAQQGQYPVIFLSLKDIKGNNWDKVGRNCRRTSSRSTLSIAISGRVAPGRRKISTDHSEQGTGKNGVWRFAEKFNHLSP